MYWASSTWATPSRLEACWAKMSRIRIVRSRTLTRSFSSRLRCWAGESSSSKITASTPSPAARASSSVTFPRPMNVATSGRGRFWTTRSTAWPPAVSSSCSSSSREASTSCARRPGGCSATSTACSTGRKIATPSWGAWSAMRWASRRRRSARVSSSSLSGSEIAVASASVTRPSSPGLRRAMRRRGCRPRPRPRGRSRRRCRRSSPGGGCRQAGRRQRCGRRAR